jgi:D-hexose-6-phosphate mutarotase
MRSTLPGADASSVQPIAFAERYGGKVVTLTSADGMAIVAVKGAQVLSWVPAHSSEVFWLSPHADLSKEKPIRGGVPVCWPWFGPHPGLDGSPSHGFARTAQWSIIEQGTDVAKPFLKLALDIEAQTRPDWPYMARVEVTVRLGSRLVIELATMNTGREPFELSEALHSYFRISDVAEVVISGLENRRFIDQLDAGNPKSEATPITIAREIDRIYQDSADTIVLDDAALRRRIRVAKSGSLSTIVWNPWIDKSARLGDMGQNGYREMVCIETANAGRNAVTIAPGGHHRHHVEFSVEAV